MAGRFDISKMAEGLSAFTENKHQSIPSPIITDRRSRSEVREDFEKELRTLDKEAIESLKDKILEIHEPDELMQLKEGIENSLVKFVRFYDEFEDLNSQESRKVALKENELKLEARYDWKEKARLFFFRAFGSVLLIITLFAIGYIEHEYEWARLPMSKYLNTSAKLP